jgi:hypothetical protein
MLDLRHGRERLGAPRAWLIGRPTAPDRRSATARRGRGPRLTRSGRRDNRFQPSLRDIERLWEEHRTGKVNHGHALRLLSSLERNLQAMWVDDAV